MFDLSGMTALVTGASGGLGSSEDLVQRVEPEGGQTTKD